MGVLNFQRYKIECTKREMTDIDTKYANEVGMNSLNHDLLITIKQKIKKNLLRKHLQTQMIIQKN